MIAYNKKILSLLMGTILFGLVGCAGTSPSKKSLSINRSTTMAQNKACFVGEHNLKKVIASVNTLSLINYKIEANKINNQNINFKNNTCFSEMKELKNYLDKNSDYILNISSVKKNQGIAIKNIFIEDVIKYLNTDDNTKFISYIDDNVKLKNSNKRISTIGELEEYIRATTPFFLYRVYNGKSKAVYKLVYKELPKHEKSIDDAIAYLIKSKYLLLNNSKHSSFDKKSISKRIDILVKELQSYSL